MSTEKEIKELEKNRRSSARAIPIYTCFLITAAVALWVLGKLFTISIWVTIIVLGITAFTLVGDIHNYFYCGRKLRTLKHDRAA
jgi:intracellular septation protein A